MTRLHLDFHTFFSEAAVKPADDAVAIFLLERVSDRALPLALYSRSNGGAIGTVDLLELRDIVCRPLIEGLPKNALCFAVGPKGERFFIDNSDELGEGEGAVFRQSLHGPDPQHCAPHLPSFLNHLIRHGDAGWPISSDAPWVDSTPVPADFGRCYAETIAKALPYLPTLQSSLQWAFRRAPSLDNEAAHACLQGFAEEFYKELPGAYTRHFLNPEAMDAIVSRLVHPYILELLTPLNDGDRERLTEQGQALTEALFMGTLNDVGEAFLNLVEEHLDSILSGFEGLITMTQSNPQPSPEAVFQALADYDVQIAGLPRTIHDLIPEIKDFEYRESAAYDFLDPLDMAWVLATLEE